MTKTKKKEITVNDKIDDKFKDYRETVDAILKSEAFTEDVEVEISAANANLQDDIIILFQDNDPKGFENIYPRLQHLCDEDELTGDNNEQLLGLIEETDITNYLEQKGYYFIKIKSAEHLAKLQEFLEAELFPYENDRRSAETNLL